MYYQLTSKPPGKEESTLNDYFTLHFESLPHKIYAAEAFDTQATALKDKYTQQLIIIQVNMNELN